MFRIVLLGTLLLVALLHLAPAYGQLKGTPSNGESISGAGLGGGSLAGSPSGWPLQGRVIMEDGSAPPERVIIESICGGISHQETKAGPKGSFFFRMGDNSNQMVSSAATNSTTAAAASGVSDVSPLGDCEVQAVLPGYRSDRISLANRRSGDDSDIGVIVLRKMGEEAGSRESIALSKVPKNARETFNKGEDAVKDNRYDDALTNYKKAVEIYPDYAEAWFQIGRIQAAKNDLNSARKSFNSAVKADRKFIPPYLQIMALDAKAGDLKALAASSEQVIRLDAVSYPVAYLYNSVANLNLENADVAEKSAREGLKLDVTHAYPKLFQVLGALLVNRGEFAPAAEQYRLYLQYAPNASDAAATRAQLEELEKLAANPAKSESPAEQ